MKLRVNGITIEAEDSGGSGEPVLLIMGLNGQLIHWPDSLLHGLTGAGHRVLRFAGRPWRFGRKLFECSDQAGAGLSYRTKSSGAYSRSSSRRACIAVERFT